MHHSISQAAHIVKRAIRIVKGSDAWFPCDAGQRCVRVGYGYGAWDVVPSLIGKGDLAFCFGMGKEITLETELARRFGMDVHAFDPTPESLEWVATQQLPSRMHVHPVGIADRDGILEFAAPRAVGEVSLSAIRAEGAGNPVRLNVSTLDTLMVTHSGGRPLVLLKMDVEGSEYAVINHLVASNIRPKQLLVEFHHRFPEVGIGATKRAVQQLRDVGYRVARVSASGEEFTFVLNS